MKAKKIGKRNGKQRYECKICEKKFQLKTRPKKGLECLWKEYAEGKQTQQQIATKNNVSRKWINNQLQKKRGVRQQERWYQATKNSVNCGYNLL